MDWTNEIVLEFIKLYEKHPCIWDPKHTFYKNKNRVNDAWVDIQNSLGVPCTVKDLKRKKDSLMAAYRNYKTKIKKSEVLGSSSDDVYQPSWFAFSYIDGFLGSIYKCNQSMSIKDVQNSHHIEEINIDEDDTGSPNTVKSNSEVEPSPYIIFSQQEYTYPECSSSERRSVVSTSGKRKHSLPELERQSNEEDDECYIFGKLVAKKLRKLPESRRDLLMIKINQLIYAESYGTDRPVSSLSRSSCSYAKSPQPSIQKEFNSETSTDPAAVIKLEYEYE
ncbi:unnamed protein product [Parnassius apollo]|uniref:(apollo) hypothetical protein n=1 Tax=Parnassius apollo TaxID=110799 RepID=A0A8S3WYA3_PARAO|nr:unnamed protein product [Parnassius apollo]